MGLESAITDQVQLERRFDAAMLDIYHGAARLGYRPTRFLEVDRPQPSGAPDRRNPSFGGAS